jgi:hydroxyacylglutathione hydrolase
MSMNVERLVIERLALGPMMNFVYLIGCGETGEAAVVDPAWDVPAIWAAAKKLGLRLRHVLVTHLHPDHVNGLEELLEVADMKAYINAEEIGYARAMAARFGVSIEFMNRLAAKIQPVPDKGVIHVGKLAIECLHTPGHSPGSLCFLVGKNLFSGDTLFVDACGRVDLPGGDAEKMWWSLNRKLRLLPDDVMLYPGHDYGHLPSSTMGEQKRANPYLQIDSPEEFRRAME